MSARQYRPSRTMLGSAIQLRLQVLEMTQAAMAEAMGVSPAAVTNLIHAYHGQNMTIATAMQLERHLSFPAMHWLCCALEDSRPRKRKRRGNREQSR
jgi:plasmid maintenance system antidote protein VapI